MSGRGWVIALAVLLAVLLANSAPVSATTDSAGIFYANLIAPAHVRLRFDLDRSRWVVTDTLTIGAGEFVQREFPVPFLDPFLEFQEEKMVSQRGGAGHLRYPEKLRFQQVEGEVLAQFVVDTTSGPSRPLTRAR